MPLLLAAISHLSAPTELFTTHCGNWVCTLGVSHWPIPAGAQELSHEHMKESLSHMSLPLPALCFFNPQWAAPQLTSLQPEPDVLLTGVDGISCFGTHIVEMGAQ